MPGPPRNPDRARRNHVPTLEVQVADDDHVVVPAEPAGLTPEIQAQWVDLWSTPLARYFATSDLPALRRLFVLRSEAAEAHEEFERNPMILGSKEQEVINPIGAHALACDRAITELEDRFGLTPKARLALGVKFGEAVEARRRNPAEFGQQEMPPRADPRLADAVPAAPDIRPSGGDVDGGEPRPR